MNGDAQKSKVDSDLANRLDTLFDEDEPSGKPGQADGHAQDPLDELKSLVMSIEWEITDDVMEKFIAQIDSLKTRFGEDRILVMFLQLLGSLGLYVKTNKGQAHPNAFKLLNSVYESFENAASPGKISPSEKKKLLYVELNKYKELKEQIDTVREPEPEPVRAPRSNKEADETHQVLVDDAQTPSGDAVTRQYFDEVVEKLKEMIITEIGKVREDIERLSKSK